MINHNSSIEVDSFSSEELEGDKDTVGESGNEPVTNDDPFFCSKSSEEKLTDTLFNTIEEPIDVSLAILKKFIFEPSKELTSYDGKYIMILDRNQDNCPKVVFGLLKEIFLFASMVTLACFYCKKEQLLDGEVSDWIFFSSLAIMRICKITFGCFSTETKDKTWTILAYLSLLLGLFIIVLMYMNHWPFNTFAILYLPFFFCVVPMFLSSHDASAISPYITWTDEPKWDTTKNSWIPWN
jgi:hypothetical protein